MLSRLTAEVICLKPPVDANLRHSSHATRFASFVSRIEGRIADTPKFTLNDAHSPLAVERTARTR